MPPSTRTGVDDINKTGVIATVEAQDAVRADDNSEKAILTTRTVTLQYE